MFDDIDPKQDKKEPEDIFASSDQTAPQVNPPTQPKAQPAPLKPATTPPPEVSKKPAVALAPQKEVLPPTAPVPVLKTTTESVLSKTPSKSAEGGPSIVSQSNGRIPWKPIIFIVAIVGGVIGLGIWRKKKKKVNSK